MPKRERDEAVAELSSTFLAEMLEEILMDVVQQSHKEIARTRAVCDVCHTRCGAVHVPGPSGSRVPTPGTDARVDGASPSATGANTPVNGKDGNVYLECLECKRQIASNRYAPHLSSCMGLGNRRGAARNASAKSKELGKAGSPHPGADIEPLEDTIKPPPAKGKGKAKGKKQDDLNANGKRTGSPSVSPLKKTKKQKTAGSPMARIKAEPDSTANNLLPSATRIPSKLRASSTVSSLHRDQRSSSPESGTRLSSPAHSISTQASTALRSPAISNASLKSKLANGTGKGRGAPTSLPPPRMLSPLLPPPPPPVRMPDTGYLVQAEDEGHETGSSTDPDSD